MKPLSPLMRFCGMTKTLYCGESVRDGEDEDEDEDGCEFLRVGGGDGTCSREL
jgi:hypothetical protein